MKTCNKCNADKPRESFYRNKQRPDGLRTVCKACDDARKRAYTDLNPDAVKRGKQDYYNRTKEATAAYAKQWRQENKEVVNAHAKRRTLLVRQATPKWADRTRIRSIYKKAKVMTEWTGIQFHVDHIIPIASDLVCGLHIGNNLQIITAAQNREKGRTFSKESI